MKMSKIRQTNLVASGFLAGILMVIPFGQGPADAAAQSTTTCAQWEVRTSRAADGLAHGTAILMPAGYEPYGAQNGGDIVYLRRCAN